MKLKNKLAWEKHVDMNTDPYGKCCVDYAREWAELMEEEMKENKIKMTNSNKLAVFSFIEQRAEYLSYVADEKYGITGFMYGAAVSMLSSCWKFGEELRKWHNIDAQIGNEGEKANESGGVLNPALLNVGIN